MCKGDAHRLRDGCIMPYSIMTSNCPFASLSRSEARRRDLAWTEGFQASCRYDVAHHAVEKFFGKQTVLLGQRIPSVFCGTVTPSMVLMVITSVMAANPLMDSCVVVSRSHLFRGTTSNP